MASEWEGIMPHGIPDQPPQPEGSVHLLYNPMQPAFYDLAHHAIQTYVYRDIETALAATRYWMSQIVSRASAGGFRRIA
jgi:hypothetical protein